MYTTLKHVSAEPAPCKHIGEEIDLFQVKLQVL